MKTETFRQKFIKKAWVMGFMGFLGLLGFISPDDGSFIFYFFSFFGFFSFYWDSKIDDEIVDERLIKNMHRAAINAFTTSFKIIWVALIILNTPIIKLFPFLNNFQAKYNCLLIVVALAYAIAMNLNAYLTYKYETKE